MRADEYYTVDGRWDDSDIIGYLEGEHPAVDEIESVVYRPLTPDGEPDDHPRQERCERYDGPFSEDASARLRDAAGALVYTSMTFDPCDDDEMEAGDYGMDAEDKVLELYGDRKDLESAWSRTRSTYDNGDVTRPW